MNYLYQQMTEIQFISLTPYLFELIFPAPFRLGVNRENQFKNDQKKVIH